MLCIVPSNSNPLLKLPDIFEAICAELDRIPVLLGRVDFILEPSPLKRTPSSLPNEPVIPNPPDIEDDA